MKNQLLLHLPFVLILIFIVSSKLTHAKSTIEPCTSSDSCLSLLSYVLPWDSKLSEIAYRFQSGESLSSIGVEFGTTVMELVSVNGLDQPGVDPGDILAIPISACSSANLNWYNESLIVPNGSYALTASNCIKCICRPSSLNLQCFPSGIVNTCSHLQCKGSNLFIGDVSINQTATGCNVSTCVYRGHNGGKIFRGLVNSSHSHCSDDEDYSTVSPVASPKNPTVPYISLPPSQSPFPNPAIGTGAYGPSSRLNPSSASKYGRLLSEATYYSLWVVLCLFF